MSNAPTVPCAKEEGSRPQKISKRKKYMAGGVTRTGWSQEELPKILKKICETYPGITWIEVRPNEIHWNFECRKEDLLPQKHEFKLENPSKRKEKKFDAAKLTMP